jgi:hypothetical protein
MLRRDRDPRRRERSGGSGNLRVRGWGQIRAALCSVFLQDERNVCILQVGSEWGVPQSYFAVHEFAVVRTVLQNFFWDFSRGASAFARKLCRGSHEQSDFQAAVFVSSSQGIASPKIHIEEQIAEFSAPSFLSFKTKSAGKTGTAN